MGTRVYVGTVEGNLGSKGGRPQSTRRSLGDIDEAMVGGGGGRSLVRQWWGGGGEEIPSEAVGGGGGGGRDP